MRLGSRSFQGRSACRQLSVTSNIGAKAAGGGCRMGVEDSLSHHRGQDSRKNRPGAHEL
jgi:uncharacterized protein (DUF849 family)